MLVSEVEGHSGTCGRVGSRLQEVGSGLEEAESADRLGNLSTEEGDCAGAFGDVGETAAFEAEPGVGQISEEQATMGEKAEDDEVKPDKHSSDELMKLLQKKGKEELWAIDRKELKMTGEKFDSGSGGELFRVQWRGLECVAKTCPLSVEKQVLVDLANEIKVLSTLRHPNLVMFLGACFEPHKPPLMLMEYCGGGNLEKKLCKLSAQASKLKMREALEYTYELALAINFLHNCVPPVVHRDLKPSSILLTKAGQVKVTDFGLSKFIPKKKQKQQDRYTMTGETGSYRFMAPEVFKHEEYNEKVDVYSFGLIVYWMLTGQRPFADIFDPVKAARQASLGKRKPSPALIKPFAIRDIIGACWNMDPDDRPEFSEILETLQKLRNKDGQFSRDSCNVS